MDGWFAVKRGITTHPLFKGQPERLAVWMWLMDNVAWKDTQQDFNGKIIAVPRGSVCASPRHIAREVGVGHQVVRTALKRFQTEHMVNTNLTHGKSVITLCNYDKYQTAKTPTNTRLTHAQHTPNTQKEQGNKVTRETNVSQDARAAEILSDIVPQQIAADFVGHRRDLKKPLTERAAKAMVKKIEAHHDPGAVLQDSIANGWQGVFPEKTNGHRHDRPSQNSDTKRTDPALEQISRLARIGAPPGHGRG